MKSWLVMMALVIVYLSLLMGVCDAGWIYDVTGVMAPTLVNESAVSFTGELEFPNDIVDEGTLRLNLTNEFDLITGDPITREIPFSFEANSDIPMGMRMFFGTWDEQPFSMMWYDWDSDASLDYASFDLRSKGWDSMSIGLHDYQLGTLTSITNAREMPQVNEPGGLALLVIGLCGIIGYMRPRTSTQ